MDVSEISEDLVVPKGRSAEKTIVNGTVRAQVQHDHKKLLDDLINALPFDDIELPGSASDDDDNTSGGVDETPVSRVGIAHVILLSVSEIVNYNILASLNCGIHGIQGK